MFISATLINIISPPSPFEINNLSLRVFFFLIRRRKKLKLGKKLFKGNDQFIYVISLIFLFELLIFKKWFFFQIYLLEIKKLFIKFILKVYLLSFE